MSKKKKKSSHENDVIAEATTLTGTKPQMEKQLEKALKKAKPGDQIFISYSGPGCQR